jgi:head-tail adaptor
MIRGTDIGKMDVFLTIQEPTETRHATTSEVVTAWSDFSNAWAEKVSDQKTFGPQSKEEFENGQSVAKLRSNFKIRYQSGITEKMRLVRSGEYHYITGIEEIDRRKFLILRTEKRDN